MAQGYQPKGPLPTGTPIPPPSGSGVRSPIDDVNEIRGRIDRMTAACAFVSGQLLGMSMRSDANVEQREELERAAACLAEVADLQHPAALAVIEKYRRKDAQQP